MLFVWWLVGETTVALLLISTGVIGFERTKKLLRTVRFGIRIVRVTVAGVGTVLVRSKNST